MTRDEAIAMGNEAIGELAAILDSDKPNREIEDALDIRDKQIMFWLNQIHKNAETSAKSAEGIQRAVSQIRKRITGRGETILDTLDARDAEIDKLLKQIIGLADTIRLTAIDSITRGRARMVLSKVRAVRVLSKETG